MDYSDSFGEFFGRLGEDGNVAVLRVEDCLPATRLDASVYPVGSQLSARHEHAEGIVLTFADAKRLGIKVGHGQDHRIIQRYRDGLITKAEAVAILAPMPTADWAIKELDRRLHPTPEEHALHSYMRHERYWRSNFGARPATVALILMIGLGVWAVLTAVLNH